VVPPMAVRLSQRLENARRVPWLNAKAPSQTGEG
jgi:hypothetical protein